MYVKDKEGRTHEVEAEEAQKLVESGEAEIVSEPPLARMGDATSKKAKQAEKRAG